MTPCRFCLGPDDHPLRPLPPYPRLIDFDFARHDAYARLHRSPTRAAAEKEADCILELEQKYRTLRGWSEVQYPSETRENLIAQRGGGADPPTG